MSSIASGMSYLVTVFLDGDPVQVPNHVQDIWQLRSALGIRGDYVVWREGMDHPVDAADGWVFRDGDRYTTTMRMENFEPGSSIDTLARNLDEVLGLGPMEDEDPDRRPWSTDPDAWKAGSDE